MEWVLICEGQTNHRFYRKRLVLPNFSTGHFSPGHPVMMMDSLDQGRGGWWGKDRGKIKGGGGRVWEVSGDKVRKGWR